jgi:uncharacterized membrane protein YcaP (DUF421 family)
METVVRVFIIYVFLLIGLKLIGKREFSQLSTFEFVTLLIIPEIVSQALVRNDYSLSNALIGVSTLLMIVFGISILTHMKQGAEKLIGGEPSIIIRNGFLVTDSMNKERVSPTEIYAEMHRVGLEDVSQVKWGILEADGNMTFVRWNSSVSSGAEVGATKKKSRRG